MLMQMGGRLMIGYVSIQICAFLTSGSPFYGEFLTFFAAFSIETSLVRTGRQSGGPAHEVAKESGKEGQIAFQNSGKSG
jgi:hypothetical protein